MQKYLLLFVLALFLSLSPWGVAQEAASNLEAITPSEVTQETVPVENTPANNAEAEKTIPAPVANPLPVKGLSQWNFAKLSAKDTGWKFPKATYLDSRNGVIYRQKGKVENGPTNNQVNFKSKQKQQVTVVLKAFSKYKGEVKEEKLRVVQFYWARALDVNAADGKWAFSKERKIDLKPKKENSPYWVANIYRKEWSGEINRLFIKPVLENYLDGTLPEGMEIEFLLERIEIE